MELLIFRYYELRIIINTNWTLNVIVIFSIHEFGPKLKISSFIVPTQINVVKNIFLES